jgi:hypothetical protein
MADPTFDINAQRLLSAIKATLPLASDDEKRPHLTVVRFYIRGDNAEVSATNGHALAKVIAPLESGPMRDFEFQVQKGVVPMLLKALAQLDGEQREKTDVRITVGKHRIKAVIGDIDVTLPNISEQLLFPDIEKAIPLPPTGATSSVTTFGVDPSLLAKVMGAAAHIGSESVWSSPESPQSGIRFDVLGGEGGLAGTYVVMPLKLWRDARDDEEESDDRQQMDMGLDREGGESAG